MKTYWRYLHIVLVHKWFVFLECHRAGITYRGLMHDYSKLFPDEFRGSCRYFTEDLGELPAEEAISLEKKMERGWHLHKHRQKHHPEWWVPVGKPCKEPHPMDKKSRLEMVCDWKAAEHYKDAKAVVQWYQESKDDIPLHPDTRTWVEDYLGIPSS